jgi:hypothetical protein
MEGSTWEFQRSVNPGKHFLVARTDIAKNRFSIKSKSPAKPHAAGT